jgi:hypothetical protein
MSSTSNPADAALAGFDPAGAAIHDGIYGLPHTPEQARVVIVPVPWEPTTSYRRGTAKGPAAILAASRQVDLFDLDTGRPYEAGIAHARRGRRDRRVEPRRVRARHPHHRGRRPHRRRARPAGGAPARERALPPAQRARARDGEAPPRSRPDRRPRRRRSRGALRRDPRARRALARPRRAPRRRPRRPPRGLRGLHLLARLHHAQRRPDDPRGGEASCRWRSAISRRTSTR